MNIFKLSLIFLLGFTSVLQTYPCNRTRHLYILGDGTAADEMNIAQSSKRGWGQVLPSYLSKKIEVRNFSSDSASTRSVIADSMWLHILEMAKYNDFLLINLGHNDMDITDTLLYSDINDYEKHLTQIVSAALEKRLRTILVTPTPHYSFEHGKYYNSLGAYSEAVRQVAKRMQIPVISLDSTIARWYDEEGTQIKQSYFISQRDKVLTKFPLTVNSYFNESGALKMAKEVALAMQKVPHIRRFVVANDSIEPEIVYTIPVL